MEILDGKALSKQIKEQIKNDIQREFLAKNKKPPFLACIIVGDNPASKMYVASKQKACEYVGIKSCVINLPQNASQKEVVKEIEKLNKNKDVSAILLQLPLPDGLNTREIISHISPDKDVDALCDINLGKLFAKTNTIAPCTATGIVELIKHYGIKIKGKKVVVVGRSLLVGKSVATLFEENDGTVTLCHSKTKDLKSITLEADIIVVAVGKANLIKEDMVKEGAVVVDVGINRLNGKIVGDVDFEKVAPKCSYISPVPGGVGPMTIAELLSNTLTLHKNLH